MRSLTCSNKPLSGIDLDAEVRTMGLIWYAGGKPDSPQVARPTPIAVPLNRLPQYRSCASALFRRQC